jgi:hypothetical protein
MVEWWLASLWLLVGDLIAPLEMEMAVIGAFLGPE